MGAYRELIEKATKRANWASKELAASAHDLREVGDCAAEAFQNEAERVARLADGILASK